MRILESKLRKIIRGVISESVPYGDFDEFMAPGSYGELGEGNMSLEELESYLDSHSYEIELADGYDEVMMKRRLYHSGRISLEEYLSVLRPFIGDIIEIYGRSSF